MQNHLTEMLITKMIDAIDTERSRCPLQDNRLIDNMIFKFTVKKDKDNNYKTSYIGATKLIWKNRCYNCKLRFNNRKYTNIIETCIAKSR